MWEILHLVCIFVNNNKGLQQNSLKKKKFKIIFFELVPTWYSGILESLHMVLTWLLVSVWKQKGWVQLNKYWLVELNYGGFCMVSSWISSIFNGLPEKLYLIQPKSDSSYCFWERTVCCPNSIFQLVYIAKNSSKQTF